ncbi:hypothetical protein [Nostoc sp. CCY 9925]
MAPQTQTIKDLCQLAYLAFFYNLNAAIQDLLMKTKLEVDSYGT